MDDKNALVIVNFGGPREIGEIGPFLRALLTDQDVLRTRLPRLLHRWLFTRVAKKRARKIEPDYVAIGGKSPIYADTEAVAAALRERVLEPVLTFHRYLPATHAAFRAALDRLAVENIYVFPMFPQFTYATTGSVARWFAENLTPAQVRKLRWFKSYPDHPAYVDAFQQCIRNFLTKQQLAEEDTVLLFSAHGIPREFVETGDIYEAECRRSFEKIGASFPKALKQLSYQSRFGPEEWLQPYTDEHCRAVRSWHLERRNIVFVPLSFTSDHIETLFEIEQLYLPIIREQGLNALRCPALNRAAVWMDAIATIVADRQALVPNHELIFRGK